MAGTESGASLTSLFHETLQRLGRQSAHCKLGAALGLAIVLVLALQGGNASLLWGAAPLALLALADAGYAAQARRIAEFGRRLNGPKDSVKPGDLMHLEEAGWGFQGALSGLIGFLSFTVWPFYLCLAGLAIGLGVSVVPAAKVAPSGPVYPPGFVPPSAVRSQQLSSIPARSPLTSAKPQAPRPFPNPANLGTGIPANGSRIPVRPTSGTPPSIVIPGTPASAPKITPAPVPGAAAPSAKLVPATTPPAAPAPGTSTPSVPSAPAAATPPATTPVAPPAAPPAPAPALGGSAK